MNSWRVLKCGFDDVCIFPASHSKDYDCDCMAFALLSHGEDGGLIHGTDDVIQIDSLLAPLKHEDNMKHFAGKPKLIFVQVALASLVMSCIKLLLAAV